MHTEEFEKAARAWCDAEIANIDAIAPKAATGRLLLGCTVFGPLHTDRFFEFCVRSLWGNLEITAQRVALVIHTDKHNVERLRDLVVPATIIVNEIPDDVMAKTTNADRFALVSAATSIQMRIARQQGCDFHLLVPDHVYARGFFHNLEELAAKGHKAIVGGGLSAHVDGVWNVLSTTKGNLDPDLLNGLAMSALHPQFRALIRNGRDDYPLSTLHLYVSPTSACIVSPHMAPLFLAHELLCRAKLRPFVAIDGQLPELIPEDVGHYVPSPEDGVTYIEISGDEKPANTPDMSWSAWDYCVEFYRLTERNPRWFAFLKTPTWVRFPLGISPAPVMPESEIEAAVAATCKAVEEGFEQKLVNIYDPTDVLEPPYLGAMFFDAASNVFYQARGVTAADWRFVPPGDLAGGFWKVYDFFVGCPAHDPRGPMVGTRHRDAQLVRETMELNGVHVLDFGGLCWETHGGIKVYLVKIKMNRTHGFKLFAGFASEKPNSAKPVEGLGFQFEDGVLRFGTEARRHVLPGDVLGLRIEVTGEDVFAFVNDKDFGGQAFKEGTPLSWPALAMFEVADGPRPYVPGYDGAVDRHMNGAY